MAEAATRLPVKTEKAAVPAAETGGWTPFESLRREIDRLFDDFKPYGWRLPSRPSFDFDLPATMRGWSVHPAFDLIEKKSAYEITAELPGIEEKDVEIKLSNHTLTIKGEKSESREEKDNDRYLSERRYGSFQRSFRVPEGVDADKIDASFSKGVLTVRMPKTVEAQKAEKKIAVTAA